MKRRIYRIVHKTAELFGLHRLSEWAYMGWFRSYVPSGSVTDANYWAFADDYLKTMGG